MVTEVARVDRAGENSSRGSASPATEPSLTESALWLLAAKVFSFAFAIALPLILTRRLSTTDFGTYKQVFLVVGTAVAVLPLNLGLSAFYFLTKYPDRRGAIVANVLLFYLAIGSLAALAIAMFPSGLAWAFNASEATRFAPGIALLVSLSVVASFLEIAPIANKEFRLGSALIVGTQLTRTALLVAAALLSGSIAWLLTAAIVYAVVQTLVMWTYLGTRFRHFWLQADPSLLWQQCIYALPFAFTGVLWTVQTDLHQYLVSSRFGASAYAIYAVGCFQLPLVGLLLESINSVLLPRFSSLAHAGDTHEIFALTVSASRKLALAIFPLYAFLAVFGREFLVVLFTAQYLASWPVFAINITTLIISVVPLGPIFRAYPELSRFLSVIRIGSTLLLAVSLLLGARWFGVQGVIGAVVMTMAIENVVTGWRAARHLRLTAQDMAAFRPLASVAAAAAIATLVGLLVRQGLLARPPLAVLVGGGLAMGSVYLWALVGFGVLSAEEKRLLPELAGDTARRIGSYRAKRAR